MPLQFAHAVLPADSSANGGPGSRRLLRLFYASKSKQPLGKEELTAMVANFGRHNAELGVTGLLCYKNRVFAQILEGEENAVLALYLRILKDPRHEEATLLSIALVPSTFFGQWRMGYLEDAPLLGDTWEKILRLRSLGEGALQEKFRQWLSLLEQRPRD